MKVRNREDASPTWTRVLSRRTNIMFSQLGDRLQDIFKELRGHGTISESNIDVPRCAGVRLLTGG